VKETSSFLERSERFERSGQLITMVSTSAVSNVHFHSYLKSVTSGRRILTKGRIAILSPLAAANVFVRPQPHLIHWVTLSFTKTRV